MVEHLASMLKDLGSNPGTTKKEEEEEGLRKRECDIQ